MLDRAAHRRDVGVDRGHQHLARGRPQHDERVEGEQLEAVELVQRPHQRDPHGGPRGQLAEVVRSGRGQVRAREEQTRQPVVGPAAQLVGQGAVPVGHGGSAHRSHATGPGTIVAAVTAVEVRHGAASDVGLVRETNEDAWLAAPPLFLVADGMGGHDAGDVASALVVEEFRALLADPGSLSGDAGEVAEQVEAVLRTCQERITAYDEAQRAAGATSFSSGTTVVLAVLTHDDGAPAWLLAHVGDSRAYRAAVSGGDLVLRRASVDHSLVQEMLDAGLLAPEDARHHPERHVVTRALGGAGDARAEHRVARLGGPERLVLCSDGISDMIDDTTIAAVLAAAPEADQAARDLVAVALEAGGRDNATALVVDVVPAATTAADDAAHRPDAPTEPERQEGPTP